MTAKSKHQLRPVGEVPDGINLDNLVITFMLDNQYLQDGEGRYCAWVDMQTAPAKGDIVLAQAVGLEGGPMAVRCRCWVEHNWMLVFLEVVDG